MEFLSFFEVGSFFFRDAPVFGELKEMKYKWLALSLMALNEMWTYFSLNLIITDSPAT